MTVPRIGAATVCALLILLATAAPALAVAGDVLWDDQVFHTGVVGDDIGRAMYVDALGNPIIAAQSATGASTQELLTWSYQPTGIWRWEAHWNSAASTFATVNDMALDGTGAPYIVGATQTAVTGTDMYLVRYGNAGGVSRDSFFDGAANGDDEAMAVCADAVGNAYFTGTSEAADGDMDVATVRIDATGVQTWAKLYNSPYDRFDGGFAIALSGNALYVAGRSNRVGHGDDIILIKYNAATGARQWVRRYDDSLHRNEWVSDVIATSTSVYLCGGGKFTATKGGDALIARYSSGGAQKWVKFLSGGSSAWDERFLDLQRAPNGNIVACGYVSRRASQQDWATVAYRTGGSIRWGRFLTSNGRRPDAATALDIDGNGKVYVTGSTKMALTGRDVWTVCYAPAGATEWNTGWNGADSGDDMANDIEVSTGSVWITGTTWTTANGNDMLTIKYQK